MKYARQHELCRGVADTPDCGFKYWRTWELGGQGATAPDNPILAKDWECNDEEMVQHPITPRSSDAEVAGLGDHTSRLLTTLGITEERYKEVKAKFGLPPSCSCGRRKAWLNKVGQYLGVGVE